MQTKHLHVAWKATEENFYIYIVDFTGMNGIFLIVRQGKYMYLKVLK